MSQNEYIPRLRVGKTQGTAINPGFTYDQYDGTASVTQFFPSGLLLAITYGTPVQVPTSSVTYNQAGEVYGGFSGQSDGEMIPSLINMADIYTPGTLVIAPPSVAQIAPSALGPGFFLYLSN